MAFAPQLCNVDQYTWYLAVELSVTRRVIAPFIIADRGPLIAVVRDAAGAIDSDTFLLEIAVAQFVQQYDDDLNRVDVGLSKM